MRIGCSGRSEIEPATASKPAAPAAPGWWIVPLVVAVLAGCNSRSEAPGDASTTRSGGDSLGAQPTVVRRIPVNARPELRENSGLAMSGDQPGVIFTITDSGNEPFLYALDTAGADRGAWQLRGARNVDWEGIALGPCRAPSASTPKSAGRCLYIGDVGDNDAKRQSLTLYRVAEPRTNGGESVTMLAADSLIVRLKDGARDIEAMYVASNATIYLITKRAQRSLLGRLRPARVYAVPATAWTSRQAVANVVDTLPIVPGSAPLRAITDASLSPDGRFLAVRTYVQVYLFATDPVSGRVRGGIAPSVCDLSSVGEPQGEGISWYGASRQLLLSSEGRNEPLRVIECSLPSGG